MKEGMINSSLSDQGPVSPVTKTQVGKERKEQKTASFAVGIDRSKINQMATSTEADPQRQALFEMFGRLPETMEFKPGMTLIVGENGSGKSTLAKALFLKFQVIQGVARRKDIVKMMRRGKESTEESEGVIEAQVEAEIFEPSLFIQQAGIAPELAHAMSVTDAFSSNDVQYADFPEIAGTQKAIDRNIFRLASTSSRGLIEKLQSEGREDEYNEIASSLIRQNEKRALSDAAERGKKMGSTRQTVDAKAEEIIFGDYPKQGSSTFFLDEPETGLSPMRHERIQKVIESLIDTENHPESIFVIPTNSVKLFESDLPRIDLRYPERGIFRPSEYPGYFEAE